MTKQEYKFVKLINALRDAQALIRLMEGQCKDSWTQAEAESMREKIDYAIEEAESDD